MFGKAARVKRFETVTAILESRQNDDELVGPHVLRMIRFFENLESLGVPLGNELATDIILYTLHKGYANFVVNYHMSSMDKTVHKLLGMLKTVEKSIKGEPKKNVLMVQKKKNAFKKGGNKNKKKASGKQGTGKTVAKPTKPKNGPNPDQKCFYYNQGGHWKRNCPNCRVRHHCVDLISLNCAGVDNNSAPRGIAHLLALRFPFVSAFWLPCQCGYLEFSLVVPYLRFMGTELRRLGKALSFTPKEEGSVAPLGVWTSKSNTEGLSLWIG
ncbi:hypothetical protein Salat_2535900 [Sesamum alatum]|uniref:Gag/pol protein n=1 Tax=Sesamum alatum TaxID=300844 RepID=A0AAE1XT47_9LAMI|nr:hypothetical protein Salat_2535900 [Sesamum alatum]